MSSKCILITGTRKGLGRAIAEHYLAKGNTVVGCSRGNGSIEHHRYTHYELDISDERSVVRMLRETARTHGLHALINNAGIASMNPLMLSSLQAGRELFDTNVFGPFITMREAAKCMRKQEYGRIVNFSSVAYPLDLEGEALYASSKAALESLTRIAARELASYHITVNALGPGPIDTDLIQHVADDKMEALLQRQAIPRKGTVKDVLQVIDFYLDPNSDFITGQTLYLGGVS